MNDLKAIESMLSQIENMAAEAEMRGFDMLAHQLRRVIESNSTEVA